MTSHVIVILLEKPLLTSYPNAFIDLIARDDCLHDPGGQLPGQIFEEKRFTHRKNDEILQQSENMHL